MAEKAVSADHYLKEGKGYKPLSCSSQPFLSAALGAFVAAQGTA